MNNEIGKIFIGYLITSQHDIKKYNWQFFEKLKTLNTATVRLLYSLK